MITRKCSLCQGLGMVSNFRGIMHKCPACRDIPTQKENILHKIVEQALKRTESNIKNHNYIKELKKIKIADKQKEEEIIKEKLKSKFNNKKIMNKNKKTTKEMNKDTTKK